MSSFIIIMHTQHKTQYPIRMYDTLSIGLISDLLAGEGDKRFFVGISHFRILVDLRLFSEFI